jgi:hypothetical protein
MERFHCLDKVSTLSKYGSSVKLLDVAVVQLAHFDIHKLYSVELMILENSTGN